MSQFLKCEFFTLLKLLGLLIAINILVKIIGAEFYLKAILLASVIAIVFYVFLFIWKFIRMLMTSNLEYQCKQGDTFKRALTRLSNIV